MKTLGFPRMHKEESEKRDFLPEFFENLRNDNINIYIEEGYGSKLGLTKDDYLKHNPKLIFVSNQECYTKDIVVVLRSPEFHELDYMKEGSTLLSMLHYPTRLERLNKLKEKDIFGVSMDLIRNDFLERIVVDYKGTSRNGVEVAFKQLLKSVDRIDKSKPIKVSVIGMGMVGLMAAKYSGKFGNHVTERKYLDSGIKSVSIDMLPRNVTCRKELMADILKSTDILIDASNRQDPTEYIVDNEQISYLKEQSVILDLTADPYIETENPIQVKAFEGIPTGTLDKYVFHKFDNHYETIPKQVSTKNKRTVVSCNAWPGVKPLSCMKLYGLQLLPIIQRLISYDKSHFDENNYDYFSRAICRGTIDYFENHDISS